MPIANPTQAELNRDRGRGVPEEALRTAALLYPAGAKTASGWSELHDFVKTLSRDFQTDPGPMIRSLRQYPASLDEVEGKIVVRDSQSTRPLPDLFVPTNVLISAEKIALVDLANGLNHMTQGGMAWRALNLLATDRQRPPLELMALGHQLHLSMNAAAASRILRQNDRFADFLWIEADEDIEAVRVTTPVELDFLARHHKIYTDRLMLSCSQGLAVAVHVRHMGNESLLLLDVKRMDHIGAVLDSPRVGGLINQQHVQRISEWAATGGVAVDPKKASGLPKTWGVTMVRQDILNAIAGAGVMFELDSRERAQQQRQPQKGTPGTDAEDAGPEMR